MTFKSTTCGLIRQPHDYVTCLLFGKLSSRANRVSSGVRDVKSSACKPLPPELVFAAVVCLASIWKTAAKLCTCGHLKSGSVAGFGGAQGGPSCVYFWVAGGFLLLSFLLLSPALWCSPLHSQVVDPVGFWVGDIREGDFVDGGVVWVYEQKEKCGETKRPSAERQPKLEWERTDRQVPFDTCFWHVLFACFCLLLNTHIWEAGRACGFTEDRVTQNVPSWVHPGRISHSDPGEDAQVQVATSVCYVWARFLLVLGSSCAPLLLLC